MSKNRRGNKSGGTQGIPKPSSDFVERREKAKKTPKNYNPVVDTIPPPPPKDKK